MKDNSDNLRVPPNQSALREALELSDVLLRNIELAELPLSAIALKSSRLARLLNDFDHQKIMEYEAGGYPTTPTGIPPDVWRLAVMSGRTYQEKNQDTLTTLAYTNSIAQLESNIEGARIGIDAARDRDVAVSSSNPNQFVHAPIGNQAERSQLHNLLSTTTHRLASRRAFIHSYVQRKYYELKFSNVASDVFSRIREAVDTSIGTVVPEAANKFIAVYQNLTSDNPEDWSNAVHSCRRILQSLADVVFPSQEQDRYTGPKGKEKAIKLGPDNYVNRLMCFVEDNSKSQRFEEIVGSHLRYLGERLESIFQAAQKGSHGNITTRAEADRYVVYTYMVVGDILSIRMPRTSIAKGSNEGMNEGSAQATRT